MSGIEVVRWSFWSPESGDPRRWFEHWRQEIAEPGDGDPPVERIPPMQRRRMSRLTRMALASALEVAGDDPIEYSIFCSQHGEINRTRDILTSMSDGEEISPAAFAQSVHNTSSGLYTIIANSTKPSTSIASGASSFAHAWIEAQSYLKCHPDHQVLLVDFDEAIPGEYRRYTEQVQCDHALALILQAAPGDGINMSHDANAANEWLPQGPLFLAWFQTGRDSLSLGADGQGWRWQR